GGRPTRGCGRRFRRAGRSGVGRRGRRGGQDRCGRDEAGGGAGMTRAWQGSVLAAMFSLAAPAWAQAPIQIVPPAAQTPPPKPMTLLGELYANGFGVPKDDQKALAWFSLAVDRGDREAMFELAMLRLAARGGPRDRDAAAALLERSAMLGHVAASYNLALLYLEGQQFDRDFGRAAELLRGAADAGNP